MGEGSTGDHPSSGMSMPGRMCAGAGGAPVQSPPPSAHHNPVGPPNDACAPALRPPVLQKGPRVVSYIGGVPGRGPRRPVRVACRSRRRLVVLVFGVVGRGRLWGWAAQGFGDGLC